MEVDGKTTPVLRLSLFQALAKSGINAVVTNGSGWSAPRHKKLVRLTKQAHLRLIEPHALARTTAGALGLTKTLRTACAATTAGADSCAVVVPSAATARSWIKRGTVRYVVLHIANPKAFAKLHVVSTKKTRFIGIVKLPAGAVGTDVGVAMALAGSSDTDLGVTAVGGTAAPAMTSFLQALQTSKKKPGHTATAPLPPPDVTPPTAPTNLTLLANGQDFLTVGWTAATDDLAVTGYQYFLDGVALGTTDVTYVVISKLECGTYYNVGIEAFDAAGNHSPLASIDAQTQYGCNNGRSGGGGGGGGGGSPPPAPTALPAPTGLAAGVATQTTATLSWTASSDSRVVGYDVYFAGVAVGTTSVPAYSFSGLTCGTTYTVGADAYDGGGAKSTTSTLLVTTAACPDTTPPSAPGNLAESSSTTSSLSAGWTASSDNVGVTGYRVFVDGTLSGTTAATSYTVSALACGTSHQIVVDAHDAAGNNSTQASATMATAACAPPPPGDTTAPSTPGGLAVTAAGQTTLSLSWAASTDDVAVVGYGVYLNGTLVATPATTSFTISALTCGTSYTVAVDAYDAAGNRSAKATLTSSSATCPDTTAPSVPTGLATSAVGQTSLTLSWTASTDNVGVTGYGVYKNGTLTASPAGTSSTLSGLTCGTSYTLAVDAVDAAGNRSAKATLTASTAACPDTTAPSTPTGLAVTASTQTSISLSWTASTDNVGVTAYGVYKNGTLTASPAGTSSTLSGLTCGTSYTLAVDAADAAGNRSAKATLTSSTAACPDTTAPSVPSGLAASSVTQTSLTLSWTASTDNVGVTGYGVYKNGTLTASPSGTSVSLTGLTCGTSYSLAVDAADAAGNRSAKSSTLAASTSACPDTTPPSTPTGLGASGVTQTSVTLSWTASTDNVGVTGYGVYVNGSLTASPSGTTSTLTGLACGTSYTLAVDAVDAAGNRSAKATVTSSTAVCPDTTPPSVPSGLAASSVTQTSLTLSWTASTDNVGVTGYGVYKNGTLTASPSGTTVSLTGLTCGTSYSLAVDAVDAAGNRSAKSSTLAASTSACSDTTPPTVPTGLATSSVTQTSLTLSWTASTDNVGVTGYGVYKNGTLTASPSGTSSTLSGLTCGTSYTLAVDAVDAAGNRSAKGTLSTSTAACPDTTPPSVPSGLAASGVGQTAVTLTWTASTDNVGVTGYRVYQGGTQVGTSLTTSYLVGSLSCGTPYSLGVTAVDAAGNVSGTAAVSVTTAACGSSSVVYVSPSGSDAGSCSQSQPCLTFDRAAAVAGSGGTVQVASGSYGTQTVTETVSDGYSSRVVFRPAGTDNSVVSLSALNVEGARNLEFDYMTAGSVYISWNGTGGVSNPAVRVADNIRLVHDHLGSQFGGVEILGATNSIIDQSEIGPIGGCPFGQDIEFSHAANCSAANGSPIVDVKALMCGTSAPCAGTVVSDASGSGITNSTIHDINYTNTADHQQCVGLWGPQNLIFTGNRLWNCGGNQGILLSSSDGATGSSFVSGTIANNYFGTVCDMFPGNAGCGGSQSISWNNSSATFSIAHPLMIVNNSFAGAFVLGNTGGAFSQTFSGSGSLVVANNVAEKIATNSNTCPTFPSGSQVTMSHNYVTVTTCGSDILFTDPLSAIWTNWTQGASSTSSGQAAPDMSLTTTGVQDLAGKADPTYAPAADINGTPRPSGGTAPDVGAYESSSG